MGGRRRGRSSSTRNKRAKEAIEVLEGIIDNSSIPDPTLAATASRDLMRVVKRHSVQTPHEFREKVCRSCYQPMVHGRNTRVRLSRGLQTTTCLNCGMISRKRLNPAVE